MIQLLALLLALSVLKAGTVGRCRCTAAAAAAALALLLLLLHPQHRCSRMLSGQTAVAAPSLPMKGESAGQQQKSPW